MAQSLTRRRPVARERPATPLVAQRQRTRWSTAPVLLILGWALLAVLVALGVAQPWLGLAEPGAQHLTERLQPPIGFGGTWEHPFGTDQLGRDLLSRLLAGARVSLGLATLGVTISLVVGSMLGLLAGFRRGVLDHAIMFIVDVQLSIPFLAIALVALTLFGTGLPVLIVLLGLSGWEQYARLARALSLRTSQELYVIAARSLGASTARVLSRHVLPNIVAPLLVLATLQFTSLLLLESSLSFLGLGVQPPTPSWGNMLGDARNYLQLAWWTTVAPGLALLLVTLVVNATGDWLRDVTDPVLRRR
ncbi:ABC transporter permease [Thermomicrobiaceae bacterium CFH 74404]|uniref:ABC transporter permease n=1 Tax=Thermalbibacter longus TaxID=2951981 RepID=A0AA41WET3_9BACT|nr:ABC transporter permease [Thermalbibacter longus]MCM8748715.1 ABC transporter permease [Thermalbibacter longus]